MSSLDGLRGLAAVIVVVHHCLLTFPSLSAAYLPDTGTVGTSSWLVYSPLHIVWAGGEAVSLFFVLSGFVLTLPVIRRGHLSWLAYYPSRLVRLYLPVLASLALALVLSTLVPRAPGNALSGWERIHTQPVTAVTIAKDALLIGGTSPLNSPLWSLRWEVLFSLALPLYVWLAIATRRFWWGVLIVALTTELVASAFGLNFLTYPPMFMIGCVMAVASDQLGRVAAALEARGPWAWRLLAGTAAIGITFFWTTYPASSDTLVLIAPAVVLCSVTVTVFMASHWSAFSRILCTPCSRHSESSPSASTWCMNRSSSP